MPADRFASARAFSEALANPACSHAQTIAQHTKPIATRRVAMFATAAIAVAALVGAYVIGRSAGPDIDQRPEEFFANIPDNLTGIARCCGMSIALSPDGRTLVFVGTTSRGTGSLYRLDFDQLHAEVIPDTEEGASPFFSPNGEWLGFEAVGTIKKVRLTGGPAELIAVSGGSISSATWTDRDQIVYAVTPMQNTLFMVSADGQGTVTAPLRTSSGFLHPACDSG